MSRLIWIVLGLLLIWLAIESKRRKEASE